MSILDVPGIVRTTLPLNGGLDESSPVTSIAIGDVMKMENFRLSKDGKRIEKRLGLAEEVTNFGEDVYGYATYRDASSNYCQLAILESEIQRKVGSGSWTNIHDFSSNIAHPVRPLEIQGKQFIINEVNSRMIHTNGSDYQIGITAPTTLPTASEAYSSTETMGVSDTMNYANQGAMDAVWTDGDTGDGASTLATSGPATQGPDADAKYMKFACTSGAVGTMAKRSMVPNEIGNKFSIEMPLYIDQIGNEDFGMGFNLIVYNGLFITHIAFDRFAVKVRLSNYSTKSLSTNIVLDTWQKWKFLIDGTDANNPTISCYLGTELQGTQTFSSAGEWQQYTSTSTDSVQIYADGLLNDATSLPVVYVDSIKIASSTGTVAKLEGTRRYAVTYVRGGNYGCESNPIKSVVGSKTFVGTGLNDMTPGGTYTGSTTKTFRVQIDSAGTPDKIKWSDDDGATWSAETMGIATTTYLPYGIQLTFAATTGHTSGDYWYFTCSVCSGAPTKQAVTLASIPVSSDAQVTARNLYATTSNGTKFYFLAQINDNTTTTFKDNIPDIALGAEMEDDHDILPVGKFSCWWDERLWVSGDDIVYYSQISYPEHFDITERYITVQKGDMGDEITGMIPYKDSLYVFRKKSIYAIQKTTLGYGLFLVDNSIGCRASWSIVEVNNMLMFISDRGIEVFNGESCYPKALSDPVQRTIATIDTSKYEFITAVFIPQKYEVWFSIPDRTSGSAITLVYNYIYDKFYTFSFYKTPSILVTCEDSSYNRVIKMGTRDGYLDLCESTYRDNTTAITATYRTGWLGGNMYEDVRMIETECEIPASMTLTMNAYVNFDKDVFRTAALTGSTPSATDIELRRPITNKTELGQRGEFYSFEYTNAENLGGDLKINKIRIYHVPRVVKGKVYGD